MKKYLIYTTNSTEPFVVETKEDLINELSYALSAGEQALYIKHTKNLMAGTFNSKLIQ